MTDNNKPFYLLPDLVEELESEIDSYKISISEGIALAYAAGADFQLDRDAKWLDGHALFSQHLTITPPGDALREAMRPSLSLKAQALQALTNAAGTDYPVVTTVLTADQHALIRSALQSLPD